MSISRTHAVGSSLVLLALTLGVAACDGRGGGGGAPREVTAVTAPEGPMATAASGTISTLLGRGTVEQAFRIKRDSAGDDRGWPHGRWEVELSAKPGMDVAVQRIEFPAGSSSGWHRHPGPVLITVTAGSVAFYEADDPTCTPIVKHAGEVYLDVGDHPHYARNESSQTAANVVVYLAPPKAASLRIDAPRPGNCAF